MNRSRSSQSGCRGSMRMTEKKSASEILAALFFSVMRIDPRHPDWEERARFILSKGHAAPVYYAALARRGYFPEEMLQTYDELDSLLQAHPDRHCPGVDMSSGSLGQGLSVGPVSYTHLRAHETG